MTTNDDCRRLLGKIKHLRSDAMTQTLATERERQHWREEIRSYAAELATELLRLNPDVKSAP